jgi:hypothetical protein
MNNQQNQEDKSFDVVLVLGLLACCVIASAYLIAGTFVDKTRDRALKQAESLAFQLIQIQMQNYKNYVETITQRPIRHIANEDNSFLRSEGEIGEDPWGAPYKYKIFTREGSAKAQLVLWSSGPSGKNGGPQLDEMGPTISDSHHFMRGQNIGIVMSFDMVQ